MAQQFFGKLQRTGLQVLASAVLLIVVAPVHAGVLWYNGDYDDNDASTNESEVPINEGGPYVLETSLVYNEFIVPVGQVWTLNSMSTNNQLAFEVLPTTGTWQIRTGISDGNGGTLVFSGDTTCTPTETHAADGNNYLDPEYNISVTVPNVVLTAGTYWMAVAPDDGEYYGEQSYIETTSGANAIGLPPGIGLSFINNNLPAADGGEDFASAPDPDYSASVSGTAALVPEPIGWPMLAAGLVGGFCLPRHRRQSVPGQVA
jgi:hypothetical protein